MIHQSFQFYATGPTIQLPLWHNPAINHPGNNCEAGIEPLYISFLIVFFLQFLKLMTTRFHAWTAEKVLNVGETSGGRDGGPGLTTRLCDGVD